MEFNKDLFNEIMAKPQGSWTQEEISFIDYVYCLTQNDGAQIKPFQTLPSGRVLHNPAQKTIKSADKMASSLIKNAGERGDDWLAGMNSPSRDPVKAAIDNEAKMENNWKAAQANHKWKKNLEKVTHADIMAVVNKLGATVFTSGLAAREDKIKKAMGELQPKLQAVSNTVQAMPSGTDAEREKRMVENLKLMRKIGSG